MSNPSNPLSDFRTYSYHQFLVVTDGMTTASQLGNVTDVSVFNRADVTRDRYDPRYLGSNRSRGYVVLVDGMKDISFTIKSSKWQTIIAPGGSSGGDKHADTIEVDGEIVVVEPFGIRFLKVLTDASQALGTDPSGLIFVLKTVFVGINKNGNEEIISNVRPFLFTMTDVTAVIDTAGATYTMDIVGVNNGTAKLPQVSRIGEGINISVSTSDTVANALVKLQNEINLRYSTFKKDLDNQLKSANSTLTIDRDFKDVRYQIVTDPAYQTQDYRVADNIITPATSSPGQAQLAAGANSTVEQAIRRIMSSSLRVQKDANGDNPDNKKYIYKIVSTLLPDEEQDDIVVQYSVQRFEVITQVIGQPLNPQPGEFIEFDYMYTGNNVDVVEFDIKMDMGLSFFHTIATSPNIAKNQTETLRGNNSSLSIGPNSTVGTANAQAAISDTTTPGNKSRRIRTPLFLGATIKDPLIRNKESPLSSATFSSLLSRHAAFENVEAQMKIAGNPQLLDETTPSPIEVETGGTERPQQGTTGLSRMFRTPSLIKVNVKFPSDNALSGVEEFWYKGFYNLYSITQNFDSGLFTQDISMFSLPQEEGIEQQLSATESTDTNTDSTGIDVAQDASSATPRDLGQTSSRGTRNG